MIDKWLQARGRGFRVKDRPDSLGRTIYVLDECPFDPSHGNDSCIMQKPDGELNAKCLHNSCTGRGWAAFRDAIGKPDADHWDPPLQPPGRGKRRAKKKVVIPAAISAEDKAEEDNGEAEPVRPLTDLGNAERLATRYGTALHYCHPWKKWLEFRGTHWQIDQSGAIERFAKRTVRQIYEEAANADSAEDPKDIARWAMDSEDAKRINALITLARSEPGIPILQTELDRDPWLLNVQNGTIDLRTGVLREHYREDLLTKLAPVRFDPDAACPLWVRTVRGIFAGDDEIIEFIKRFAGYCLTGCVDEDLVPIFYGDGSNGKTVFIETLREVLGKDYADAASHDLLLVKKGERHPTEIADLHGKRLVIAQETDDGREINEALLKRLTGKDELKGRRMKEDLWSFRPTHKLVMCTNYKPAIKGQDHGIWRRIALVPFEVTFWRADRGETGPDELRAITDLKDKLLAEREGILGWMVAGCRDWQRYGMQIPEKVRAATNEYRQHEDKLAAFITDCCVTGPSDYRVQASQLYGAYKTWMEVNNEGSPLSQRKFGEQMTRKGFKRLTNNGVWYLGIALQTMRKNAPEAVTPAE